MKRPTPVPRCPTVQGNAHIREACYITPFLIGVPRFCPTVVYRGTGHCPTVRDAPHMDTRSRLLNPPEPLTMCWRAPIFATLRRLPPPPAGQGSLQAPIARQVLRGLGSVVDRCAWRPYADLPPGKGPPKATAVPWKCPSGRSFSKSCNSIRGGLNVKSERLPVRRAQTYLGVSQSRLWPDCPEDRSPPTKTTLFVQNA
jgi:hypothetical protein